MQKLSNKFTLNSRVVGCIIILCIFALALGLTSSFVFNRNEVVANAATAINNQTEFNNVFSLTSGSITGSYELGSDITISSRGLSEATFNGSLDGKGHTITITGSHTKDFGTISSVSHKYVGFIAGVLGNSCRITNLNIVVSGTLSASCSNAVKTSGDYNDGASYSSTLYLGTIAGRSQGGANLTNVNVTINSNAVIAGIGIDGNIGAKEYASGQGAVVGGLIGTSEGSYFTNIELNNNGSIWARAENKSAGQYSYTTGSFWTGGADEVIRDISLVTSTRNDRASAGGLFGETKSSTTTINSLELGGSGYVGARAHGSGSGSSCSSEYKQYYNSSSYAHNINHAGGVVGYANGGKLTINGLLYRYSGKAYVAHSSVNGVYYAGTILGKGTLANDVTINYLWRNASEGTSSGYGINSYNNSSSGPAASSLSITVQKTLASSSTLSSVGTQDQASQISYTSTNELTIPVMYEGATVSGSSASITDINNQYLEISVTTGGSYYISSLYYKVSTSTDPIYINYYNEGLSQNKVFDANEYMIPQDCSSLTVYLATIATESLYVSCLGDKQYDQTGISFTGKATKDSPGLLSTLLWVAEHDSDDSKDVCGLNGSATIISNQNVGTYTFYLYKELEDGTLEKAKSGDSLGPNRTNAPNLIYQYDGSVFSYEISRAEIELKSKSGAKYTKQYDATSNAYSSELILNRHYEFYRVDTGALLVNETPDVTIGSGKFYDSNDNETSNVGTGLTVKIEGFNVTGNYVLKEGSITTLTMTGEITKKEIGITYGSLSLTYNGGLLYPEVEANGLIGEDTVDLAVSVYRDTNLYQSVTKTDVGTFYAKIELASASANYMFSGGFTKLQYNVVAKELRLTWSNFEENFDNTERSVSCVITNKNTEVASGDTVNLTIVYTLNGISGVKLLNAGSYTAQASIDNTNYYLNENDLTYGDKEGEFIVITPIMIKIDFYTATNDGVEDLPYIATSYIGHSEGLHAKVSDGYTSLGITNNHIKISYNDTSVMNVGEYLATATLGDSDVAEENEGILSSNYAIDESTNTQIIKIIPRSLTLKLSETRAFEYDISLINGRFVAVEQINGTQGSDLVNIQHTVYTYNGGVKGENPVSALTCGQYIVEYAIVQNNNYVLNESSKTAEFSIYAFDLSKDNRGVLKSISDTFEYTGYAIIPTLPDAFLTLTIGATLEKDVHYAVSYDNNVNSTTQARIIVTGTGNFSGTIYTYFTITKKTLEVDFSANVDTNGNLVHTFAYNGAGRNIAYDVFDIFGNSIKNTTSITYDVSGTPKYVGSYVATVSFDSVQPNYQLSANEKDRQFSFSITPKNVSLTFTDSSTKVYNGKAQKVSYSYTESDAIYAGDTVILTDKYYSKKHSNYYNPINVDSYSVTVEISGAQANNYILTNNTIADYKIEEREIKLAFNTSTFVKTYTAGDLSLKFGTDYTIDPSTPAVEGENAGVYLDYQPSISGAVKKEGDLILVGEYNILAYTNNTNYAVVESSNIAKIIIERYELELYLKNSATEFYYQGATNPIDVSFAYSLGKEPLELDGNKFSIIRTFYNVENPSVEASFQNAGVYGMYFYLPADNETANNYVINQDNLDQLQATRLTIKPRPINIAFNYSGEAPYDGLEKVIEVNVGDGQGAISGNSNSGLVKANTNTYETVSFIITDEDDNPVVSVKDVGTYNYKAMLDPTVQNYVIGTGISTTNQYVITPKDIYFYTNNFSKIYGDKDPTFTQKINGVNNETIDVTYGRISGEDAGDYDFDKSTLTYDNANYKIAFDVNNSNNTHGVFSILQREIKFSPDKNPSTTQIDRFTFDYLDPINDSDLQMELSVTPSMPLFPNMTILIQLYKMQSDMVNMGIYDLSTTFDFDNDNFVILMNEDSNKNMIEILGRSVGLEMPDITITYEVDEEPNYFDYLKVIDIDKCDTTIKQDYNDYVSNNGTAEGFDWSNYIRITREAVQSELNTVGIPYKENGYKLTIEFLKEVAGQKVVDGNYRAVRVITDENGNQTITENVARLFVNKFDLNTVYGSGFDDTKPVVSTSKMYDGTANATIQTFNIKEIHLKQLLTVSATYDNSTAGTGKSIIIKYGFSVVDFANNYILPNDYVYTQSAVITPLDVTVKINEQRLDLIYGQTPSISLSYSGFIGGDNISTEGIQVTGVYNDGVALDVIRNARSDDYTIVLKVDACLTQNYVVKYEDQQIKAKISPKSVALIAGEDYEKAVDGTSDAFITSKNYVIDGILDQDKNFVHIASEDITAILDSSEPGETIARIRVTKLSGDLSKNYNLSNYELIIPAIIKKLADVTMSNASYDFDNVYKTMVPVVENALEGVGYYVEYTGINVTYPTSRQAPKNAGTYLVTCHVQNADNSYSRAMASAELTINKVKPTLYFSGQFNQTYGSFTEILASIKAPGLDQNVEVDYSFTNEEGEMPDFPPAGRHTVKASCDETANYLAVSGEQSLVIKAKTITITFDNYKGLVYNGYSRKNDISITFNGLIMNDVCEPVKLFSSDEVKNAGTYRLIVSPSNPSYVISGSNSIEFTIAKKTLTVTVGNDTTTTVGVAPTFTMQYDGFVENEDQSLLEIAPSVVLTSGEIGVNRVKYKEGFDDNYSFNYIDCVYTIKIASQGEKKPNLTPYVATACAVGSIGLIFLIGYIVKIHNYRSMTKYVAKRTIKKTMFKDKNIK